MFPLSTALVVSLIVSPSPVPENLEMDNYISPICANVAMSMELLDVREKRYTFFRKSDFKSDVTLLKRRYQELKDAPPECDHIRFPDRKLLNEMLSFNKSYQSKIEDNKLIDETLKHDILAETDNAYKVYDSVRDAKTDYYYITVRRLALKRLQNQIGIINYYNGVLPPIVPVWRFNIID